MVVKHVAEVPFSRSYWVVRCQLLAGCYPGDQNRVVAKRKLVDLVNCGIQSVINLMEEKESDKDGAAFAPYDSTLADIARQDGTNITVARIPIRDMNVPNPETMRHILDEVDRAIAQQKPVYVHCWGGRGRTGTVVGCYLARHGLAKGDAVLKMIQGLRKDVPDAQMPSPETERQREMVRSWRSGE